MNLRFFLSAFLLGGLSLGLSGCVVRTAAKVATMPIKAGAQVADWTTTSQDEADRNRGRAMRKQEKEERKQAERDRKRAKAECRQAGGQDC